MKITSTALGGPTDNADFEESWGPPDADPASSEVSDMSDWGTTSELYRSSYRDMLRVAFSITGNTAAAEDAVHDAFCAVGPRIATLDEPLPYLRVAVVNRCRSMHRSTQRAHRHAAAQLANDVAEHDRRENESRGHGLTGHGLTGHGLTGHDLTGHGLTDFAGALEQLSFAQRTAIVLRYQCDLSDDEIAAILKCRRSTVRSHVRRGLAHLRKDLS